MTFQVPRANNDLNVDRALSRITPSAESTSAPRIAAIFEVGKVLEVNVHRQAQEGIMYKGEFIKASLPEKVRHGEKLLVKVTENQELIVLRIVENRNLLSSSSAAHQSALEVFFRSLMGRATVEQLKAAGTSLAHLKAENFTASSDLKELAGHQILSTGRPEEIVKFLRLLSQSSLVRGIDQARQSVDSIKELVTSERSPAERLLNELSRELDAALRDIRTARGHGPLQGGQYNVSTTGNYTSTGGALDTLLSLITRITRSSAVLSEVRSSNPELANLLLNLEKALSRSDRLTESSGKSLVELLSGMAESLHSARRANNKSSATEAVKTINSILRGQEALNLINPLMQAMGEPALIFIPALISGLISKWEMAVYPRPDDSDSTHEETKDSQRFETVELFLTFEKLGEIGVKIACSKEELLVNITVEDKRLAVLIESRKAEALKALEKFAFNKINIGCSYDKPRSIVPGWYKALTRRSLIA